VYVLIQAYSLPRTSKIPQEEVRSVISLGSSQPESQRNRLKFTTDQHIDCKMLILFPCIIYLYVTISLNKGDLAIIGLLNHCYW